ncbi:MAG: ankyrin repeat domain-containing protein [Limisphaerales bacterium]
MLQLAVSLGQLQMVRMLLAAGANVNTRNLHKPYRNISTALHWAAWWKRPKIAEILIAVGARVDARGSLRNPPLFDTAVMNTSGVAGVLLKHGVRTDLKDSYGMTPLKYAGEYRTRNGEDLVRLLKKP